MLRSNRASLRFLDYVKDQVKNCKAMDSNMDEDNIIAHVRRNLSPEFKNQLYLFDFKNMDQFILALDRVEKNLLGEKPKEINFTSSEGGRRGGFRARGFRRYNKEENGRGQFKAPSREHFQGKGRGRSLANVQCFNCGNFGHVQKHCRPNKQVKLAEKAEVKDRPAANGKKGRELEDGEDFYNKDEDSL